MQEEIVESPGSHEPAEFKKTPKKAAASGWVGSALEYYDFFIYAQAAALIFPDIFFPEGNDQAAVVASFATFGVGYVARPIGAFVLGHWGDTHGRKNVLVLCMLLMGASTFCVALLPTYHTIGIWAPIFLVILRLIQGFAVGGEISGASAMIVEHAPFGRRGYYSSFTLQGVQAGQIIAAAVFLPLSAWMPDAAFESWGWRIPFLLSAVVVAAGYVIRRKVDETPAFQEESVHGEVPAAPIVMAVRESGSNMLRVVCMALMNAVPIAATVFGATYATNVDAYGIGMSKTTYLWISVVGNAVAVCIIPFVGNLTDRIGRRPPIIVGALGSGLLSFPYLYFISQNNVPMAFLFAVLMWGVVYQGYNATFPSFYQELFPTRTRVTAFAVSQNIGTVITSFLPLIYAAITTIDSNVPVIVGSITFGISIIVATSAFSAKETFKIHMNDLGEKGAQPVSDEEYERARETAMAMEQADRAQPCSKPREIDITPVRIAVAGAGLIGRRHIEEIDASLSAELASIIDPSPARDDLAARYGVERYGSLTELFAADRPDGVILATPNQAHAKGGLECVAAGVPVLVEKPIADNVEDATGLVEAAAAANVALLTGHHRQHSSIMATARDIIGSGALGQLVAVTGTALFRKPDDYFDAGGGWRRRPGGGPILLNLIHDVNNLMQLAGKIVSVQAMVSTAARGHQVEDTAAVVFRFANGALGTFLLSDAAASPRSWEQTAQENRAYASYDDEDCYHIAGTTGSLSVPTMRLRSFPGAGFWFEQFETTVAPIDRTDPLAIQVEHFAKVIQGEAEPVVSGRDGLNALRVTEAITEAARTGQVVETGLGSTS